MSGSNETTLQQRRAADALEKIRELAKLPEKAGKYRSYVAAFPATIVTNGLGQALAIEMARGGDANAHQELCAHVADWLMNQIDAIAKKSHGKSECVIDAIMEIDEDDYLRAQAEAIAYVSWLKRFATALLQEPDERKEPSHA